MKMFRSILPPFLIFIHLFLFNSCKKDKDEIPPQIKIVSPILNSNFGWMDTVQVVANIEDNNAISLVSVALRNGENQIIMNGKRERPGTPSHQIDQTFVLDDINLRSGENYFMVTAYDEEGNASTDHVTFNYAEPPTEIEDLIVVSTGIHDLTVFKIEQDSFTILSSVDGDYQGSAVNLLDKQFYTSGAFKGDMNAFDLLNGKKLWRKDGISQSSFPFFSGFHYFDQEVYLSYNDGRLNTFNKNGDLVTQAQIPHGFAPQTVQRHTDKTVVEIYDRLNDQRKIAAYFYPSGTPMQSVLYFHGEIVDFISRDFDEILVVSHDGAEQYFARYSMDQNDVTLVERFDGDSITSVLNGGDGSVLFCDGKDIYRFVPFINTIPVKLVTGSGRVVHMTFNNVDGSLWATSANQITVYNPVDGRVLNTISGPAGESLKAVHLVYNK